MRLRAGDLNRSLDETPTTSSATGSEVKEDVERAFDQKTDLKKPGIEFPHPDRLVTDEAL